ncbi:uncharacterized protein ppk17 [Epargyreus clarus]|uniref:uncharacterized protein ppk17 n=1 Tax=Epargyreus clarus TaxID=520877 RepID=UPI003C2B8FFC
MASIYLSTEVMDKITAIWKKCGHCLKGPNLIKTLLVGVCIVMVVQQISVSIHKLIDIPITTYAHFDFNKTIAYPSVTFCREPPYKFEKMMKYGLYSHPRFISTWVDFNFSRNSLKQLWEDITYDEDEFFVHYSLNGLSDNLNLSSTLGFTSGLCFTLTPKVPINRATLASGYAVTLQHNTDAVSTSSYPPGYHMHVHYSREPYTEVEVYNGGLVDYIYVNTGETVDVKLTVDQYIKISDEEDPCTDAQNYSANSCTTQFVWDMVTAKVGCSGPWMKSDLPYCNNYSDMAELISAYTYVYKNHEYTGCPRICRSYLYNAFVTARQSFFRWDSSQRQWFISTGDTPLFTQVYIHFNSMMVSVYEERYNYDWNLFLSDLGGSVGFLLGLSVIGLMSILTNIWYMVKSSIVSKRMEKDSTSIKTSVTTTDLATISDDHDYKNRFWNNNFLSY